MKQEFRVPPHFMEPLQEPSIYNEDVVMKDIKEEKPILTQKGKKLDKHKFVPLLSMEMYDKTVLEQLGRPLVDEEENQGFVMLGENTRGEYMCLVCGKKTIQVLQKNVTSPFYGLRYSRRAYCTEPLTNLASFFPSKDSSF